MDYILKSKDRVVRLRKKGKRKKKKKTDTRLIYMLFIRDSLPK